MNKIISGPLLRKEISSGLFSMLRCFLIAALLLFAALMLYPQVAASTLMEMLRELSEAFPKDILNQFGLQSIPDLTLFQTYFSFIMQTMLILLCVYAACRGCAALIKSESNSDIALIYAQPVSRTAIVLAKFAAQAVLLLFLNALIYVASYLLCQSGGEDAAAIIPSLWRLFLVLYFIELTYLCIGLFLSAFLNHRNQASACGVALFITTFLLGAFGSSIPAVGFMAWLSPYHYCGVEQILSGGLLFPWILPVISALFIVFAALRYQTKDMSL